MGKIELQKLSNPPIFRKIAFGAWKTAYDPSVYGQLDIDMTSSLKFMKDFNSSSSIKITPTHLIGYAVALALKKRPEANAIIRRNRIYLRKHINLFFQVNVPGDSNEKISKASLSGCTVENLENLSFQEFVEALNRKISRVKNKTDKEITKSTNLFKLIPWWLSFYFLNFLSFLIYGLNWNLKWLGIPKDPFGSVMITNVGSLGIDLAWAPLCPYSRVPFLVTIGNILEKAWVVDGEIKIRPILGLGITFDHRIIDGVHAAQMSKTVKEVFKDPEKYFI